MPIRLRESRSRDPDQVVRARIDALRRQMDALQMELEQCQSEVELSEPRRHLWVYPEYPGSSQGDKGAHDLRDWFCRTPDLEIQRYQHTRVELALPREVLPPLHLVRLPEDSQETRSVLPPSTYLLTQDLRWKAAGREVFVPHDRRLEPPPPRHLSGHVRKAMEECLWGEDAGTGKTLVFLILPNGEECRFTVPAAEWKNLFHQVPILNFQLADLPTRVLDGYDAKAVAEQLIDSGNEDAEKQFQELCGTMTRCLDNIWLYERERTRKYQEDVVEALNSLMELDPLLKELESLRTKQWKTWIDFLATALALDRETLPRALDARTRIEELDSARVQATEAVAEPFAGRKRELAGALRRLAGSIERGD
jgi:hypothetical protein